MRRSRLIPLVVSTALFMENVDSTVISTSLPEIAASLQEDVFALKLAMTSYLISLAIFIPVSGWMADRFGAKTIFRNAIIVYMCGSLGSAFAINLEMLVLTRFLQGVGGAMMVPVGRLFLLRNVPRHEIVQALAWLTIPALVGPVMGPLIGGFITTHFGWRWIFCLNIPTGCLGIFLTSRYFVNIREEDVPPLDWKGFTLSGISLTMLLLGLSSSGQHLIPTSLTLGLIIAGFCGCLLYAVYALRSPAPLLDLSLFKIPSFSISIIGGTFFRIGTGASPFLLPMMLQMGFGYTPMQSGSITFISAAGALFMKTLASRILKQFGFRMVLSVNAVIAGVFIGLCGFFTVQTPFWLMLLILFIGGCFRSLEFTSINSIAYADISNRRMSAATSLSSVMQQVSVSLGISIGAFVLEYSNAGILNAQSDFVTSFVFVALVSASSCCFFALLKPDAGADLSRHHTGKA